MNRFVAALLIFIITGCTKTEVSPGPRLYRLAAPAGFPSLADDADNPLTLEGVELGRRLFYDKRLSGNNTISCASCHQQSLAFSDGKALSSIGFSGTPLNRHAPALINVAWMNTGLFWDGGSTNLESQAFGPLKAADEMHQGLLGLAGELNSIPDYVMRFRQAFNDTVSAANVVKALAQFERTFVSAGSIYDLYKQQKATLSQEELQGLLLVQQHCQGCHKGALFTDNDYHNNGIDGDFSNNTLEGLYQGRYRITYDLTDLGKFKTPTLRNVMLTAPYMHDGRFATIGEVLDHYSSNVKASPTLDTLLQSNPVKPGISLTAGDKQAILSFLKTLTDSSFITNKSLSDPY